MILSRIVQHLRHQNWTAVAIELCIVVLGVFIGMQVSNWNAAQAEKRLGVLYTERLRGDLQYDFAAHQAVAGYYQQVLASVERANALLADPDADPKELVMHAYRASEIVNAPRTGATWEEIVSSGDTGLLPRVVLDSGLANYFSGNAMRDVYERLRDSPYRSRARSLIPLEVQKAIRAGCSDVITGSQLSLAFVPNCEIAVDERTLRQAATVLRADPGLAAELRLQYSHVASSIEVLRISIRYLQRTLDAFSASAGPAPGAS